MKGIIITNSAETSAVYGPVEMREIERRVQIIALPQTADSLSDAPERLREVEVIFSGPGLMRLDDWFLHAAPNLRAIFYAGDAASAQAILTPAVSRRGIQFTTIPTGPDADADGAFQPTGARITAELDRFLAGESLRWGVAAPPLNGPRPAPPPPGKAASARRVAAFGSVSAIAPRAPRAPSKFLHPPMPFLTAPGAGQPPTPVAPDKRGRPLLRWVPSSILAGSIIVHLIFALIAAYCIVSVFRTGHRATFTGSPARNVPSKNALEHHVQQYHAKAAAAPPVVRRVVSTSLSAISLPPVPAMPQLVANVHPVTMSGMGVGGFGFLGRGGNGTGGGGGTGGGSGGGGVNFFGLHDAGESVVVMIDVSDSMFTRTGDAEGHERKLLKEGKEQSFQVVRDEAIKLVQSLTPGTKFGVVRWSGGARSWKPQLMPANEANKTEAIAHIQDEVDYKSSPPKDGRPGGTRHDYALEEVFTLKPEVIYMITDGNATAAQPGGGLKDIPAEDIWKAADAGQKTLTDANIKRARINVVYYLSGADKPEERRMLMTLASRNGGRFITVEGKNRKRR